ncbi:diaminopimelate epimerase [Rhodothalassium salexigens]|uniref:diaminopimelate epimerase n=1 Tax=Rhodothalassium salexigens TaxID=1086 RepID=UPI001912202C|nr:diaminopimelate epimerase [Rhodothalassium salexigens]MBK5910255.1 diaminopimelate epimerase [Rhodothalassium salexigens]MBK5921384.1 diaminopimelate epimerase [Rhodothalassium salexigens]
MVSTDPQRRPFVKMHGLGNDFVVFDARQAPLALSDATVRALADRHTGIGCDQLIILRASDDADVAMEIRNADGSTVAACGNATRCVARLVMGERGAEQAVIETAAGLLRAHGSGAGVAVDMGPPGLDWQDIPLAEAGDTRRLDFTRGALGDPGAVSMGNPHLVFFQDDAVAVQAFETLAPQIERDPLFPERINVSLARVDAPDALALTVWERGAGFTRACGTAACAALVAAHRRGLTGPKARVGLPGGTLMVTWDVAGDSVILAGPADLSFFGAVDLAAYEIEAAA